MVSVGQSLFKFLLLLLASPLLLAQVTKPSWVLLEEGRRLLSDTTYNTPDVGRAVLLLREALFLRGLYPEAELYLAQAYSQEGNLLLERLHLESARTQKDAFKTQVDYQDTVYRLAELTLLEKDIYRAIEYLREIAFINPTYSEAFRTGGLAKFNEFFLERQRGREGFEAIFNLYRFPYDNSIRAHGELSKIYYQSGAYELALNHALFALIGWLSRTYEMVVYHEPEFEFTDLRAFIAEMNKYSEAKESLAVTPFWTIYTYLANAAYALNPTDNHPLAFEIWRQVSDLTSDSLARQVAIQQIQNPTVIKEIIL